MRHLRRLPQRQMPVWQWLCLRALSALHDVSSCRFVRGILDSFVRSLALTPLGVLERPGTASCPCTGVDCSGHGACHNGVCVCSDGYAGPNCDFDPCAGNDCSGHGTCSRSSGKCTCEAGFGGDDCSQGGGGCEEDKHCGIFGESTFGGQCTDGECVCWTGYTCPDCAGIGEECASARGGGPCSSVYDCGVFGAGFGGQCVFSDTDKYWITEGRCRCWPGFTCQQCNVRTTDFDAGALLCVQLSASLPHSRVRVCTSRRGLPCPCRQRCRQLITFIGGDRCVCAHGRSSCAGCGGIKQNANQMIVHHRALASATTKH